MAMRVWSAIPHLSNRCSTITVYCIETPTSSTVSAKAAEKPASPLGLKAPWLAAGFVLPCVHVSRMLCHLDTRHLTPDTWRASAHIAQRVGDLAQDGALGPADRLAAQPEDAALG